MSSYAKNWRENFSPLEKFFTVGFFLFLTSIVLFLFFHARVQSYSVQRDFTASEVRELAVLDEKLINLKNKKFKNFDDFKFEKMDIKEQQKSIISNSSYKDWSQDVAKALGFEIWQVNREFKAYGYNNKNGYNYLRKKQVGLEKWREEKRS